jgi:hypothetical protein
MLELPGDLPLKHEPGPQARVVGEFRQDLLERDAPMDLLVAGERDETESAPAVGLDHGVSPSGSTSG